MLLSAITQSRRRRRKTTREKLNNSFSLYPKCKQCQKYKRVQPFFVHKNPHIFPAAQCIISHHRTTTTKDGMEWNDDDDMREEEDEIYISLKVEWKG